MFVLPKITTPAAFNFATTVESYGGFQPCKILEPAVVGTPSCARTSLRASGTPASGPNFLPLARSASTAAACFSALSPSTCKNALTFGSTSAIRSK